ncbi:hypothetical protein ATANTOWER_019985 [Ataeniobius toweri]|uniref:Uncharacterized protein n=1 Tax=Ataeniobius toweri TaxID=208326 RepID=A0ABU7B9D3_9TELE|nr:hypothetical protein [Ataeniobius toweri]
MRRHLGLWRGVLLMNESRFSQYRADGSRARERFADVNVVDKVGPWWRCGYGMGSCYGHQTRVHFINGILNAQRYSDETLGPIVIYGHHLILQHGNTCHHVARICTQLLCKDHVVQTTSCHTCEVDGLSLLSNTDLDRFGNNI